MRNIIALPSLFEKPATCRRYHSSADKHYSAGKIRELHRNR
jgi:hypothetical protein